LRIGLALGLVCLQRFATQTVMDQSRQAPNGKQSLPSAGLGQRPGTPDASEIFVRDRRIYRKPTQRQSQEPSSHQSLVQKMLFAFEKQNWSLSPANRRRNMCSAIPIMNLFGSLTGPDPIDRPRMLTSWRRPPALRGDPKNLHCLAGKAHRLT